MGISSEVLMGKVASGRISGKEAMAMVGDSIDVPTLEVALEVVRGMLEHPF
jgi:hypothetical protein